jgi:hypothetical protein
MKKSFILTLLMSIILFCSCNSCQQKEENKNIVPDSMIVENIISTDKQAMYQINPNYRWYETLVLFNNYLDEENDGSIAEVVNIFQAIINYSEKSFDTKVYKFQHSIDGTCIIDSVPGFWIEDCPLVDSVKIMPFKQAYEFMQEANLPKPHSRHACLRIPVGPLDCNPQWCFGNIESQIWIDATTGEAKNSNPAFPEEKSGK